MPGADDVAAVAAVVARGVEHVRVECLIRPDAGEIIDAGAGVHVARQRLVQAATNVVAPLGG